MNSSESSSEDTNAFESESLTEEEEYVQNINCTLTDDEGNVRVLRLPVRNLPGKLQPKSYFTPQAEMSPAEEYDIDEQNRIVGVTSPFGSWLYEYNDSADPDKVTKVTAPGGSYVDITYRQPTQNGAGQIATITSDGQTNYSTEYDYNSDHRLISATRAGSKRTEYSYDYTTDPDHRTMTVIECDAVLNTRYSRTVYDYHAEGSPFVDVTKKNQLTAPSSGPDTDPLDETTVSEYYQRDSKNTYLKNIIDPLGNLTQNNVDTDTGLTTSVTDATGLITSYTYNYSTKKVTSVSRDRTNPTQFLGQVTFGYYSGAPNWLEWCQDVRGNYLYFVRNLAGDASQVTEVKTGPSLNNLQKIREFTYYTANDTGGYPGQLKTVKIVENDNSYSQEITLSYVDTNDKLRESPTHITYKYVDGTTKTVSASYDDSGRVLSVTDADNRTIWYRYDDEEHAESTIIKWVDGILDGTPEIYDTTAYKPCCGDVLDSYKDLNGNSTYMEYDPIGQLVGSWTTLQGNENATNRLIEYGFDSFGNISTAKTHPDENEAHSETMTVEYNKSDLPVSLSYPSDLIGSETCGYDGVYNVIWYKDGNDKYSLYHYDAIHRLDAIAYSSSQPTTAYDGVTPAPTYTFTYYGTSDLLYQVIKGANVESSFTYDDRDRIATYSPQNGPTLAYNYNSMDQVTSITGSDGYNINYNYSYGWLTSITTGTGTGAYTLATYVYSGELLDRIEYGNGTYSKVDFESGDPRYRLNKISHYKMVGTTANPENDTLLLGVDYTAQDSLLGRDELGNPRSVKETTSDWERIWTYSYGDDDRLVSASVPGPVPDQPAGGDYGYDWLGNRLSPPADPNAMVYNAADQLTRWPGMYTYEYYGDGSLHYVKLDNSSQTLVSTYNYGEDGQLREWYSGNSSTPALTNTWNVFCDRTSVSAEGGTYSFTYDVGADVPAVIKEVGPTKTYYYYRDPSGLLIARKDASVAGSYQYYHFDDLGSTRLLTDSSGDVTDTYAYDAYGSVISHIGSAQDNPYQYVGTAGYYTHYQCSGFNLLQLGCRFYDAEIGRFTQQDPAGDGIDWYSYCFGLPTSCIDPTGMYREHDSNCRPSNEQRHTNRGDPLKNKSRQNSDWTQKRKKSETNQNKDRKTRKEENSKKKKLVPELIPRGRKEIKFVQAKVMYSALSVYLWALQLPQKIRDIDWPVLPDLPQKRPIYGPFPVLPPFVPVFL